jgi:hypothetical protein
MKGARLIERSAAVCAVVTVLALLLPLHASAEWGENWGEMLWATDTDQDGLTDTEEVALGTNPNDPDTDADGHCDGPGDGGEICTNGPDNCPFVGNPSQSNNDALTAGDLCQCGNVDGVGGLDAADLQSAREALVGRTGGPPHDPDFCDVNGDGGCDIEDVFEIDRLLAGRPSTILDDCAGYGGP